MTDQQKTLFDAPALNAVCPQCRGGDFQRVGTTGGRHKCTRCGWMIVVTDDGTVRDMVDITTAGRRKR